MADLYIDELPIRLTILTWWFSVAILVCQWINNESWWNQTYSGSKNCSNMPPIIQLLRKQLWNLRPKRHHFFISPNKSIPFSELLNFLKMDETLENQWKMDGLCFFPMFPFFVAQKAIEAHHNGGAAGGGHGSLQGGHGGHERNEESGSHWAFDVALQRHV